MSSKFLQHKSQLIEGENKITTIGETLDTQMNFTILRLKSGQTYVTNPSLETAAVLLTGQVVFKFNNHVKEGQRDNIFEQDPYVCHVPLNQTIELIAGTDCELAIVQTQNDQTFEPMLFDSETVLESEHRGKGILGDSSYRIVRTVFDKRNRPNANLVVGEVITFPGCWSSYPPHHHKHPEIYHYRFTEPNGFGFAQCGNDIFKAEHESTLKILNEDDHAQVAAPGYGMYYLWLIKHLPNNPYIVPEFTQEHAWCKEQDANSRVWKGVK